MEVITVLPSRGLIFEKTIRSLKDNGIELKNLITVTGLPIPDAQNECVRQAMKEYSSYIWFIEEDMSIPEGTLKSMMKIDDAITAVDYPMDNGSSTIRRKNGEIIWCGLGCTLVKRGVLKAIGDPWFSTSYSRRIDEPFNLTRIENPNKYGGHDINFCMRARELGFTISQLPNVEAEPLRCSYLERGKTNKEAFEIKVLPSITKWQNYDI